MKVTYLEELENHMAWNAQMYCPSCGAHEYTIVEQLEPETATRWTIRCPQCGYECEPAPARDIAFAEWKNGTSN